VATFGLIAQEMYDLAGGRNEEWPRVVAMGLALDPSNALYSGGGEVSALSGVDAGPDLYGDSGSSPQGAAEFEGFGAARHSEPDELEEAPGSEAAELEVGVPPTRPMPSGIADSRPSDFAETQAMEAARAKAAGDEPPALDFSLDIDTSIGRPDDAAQRSAESGDDRRSELERAVEGRFELPSLDFGGDAGKEGQPDSGPARRESAGEPPAFSELGDFRIDLPSLEGLDGFGERSASRQGEDAELGVLSADEGSPQWQEMATKLDLASAYEEIGDKDGARELLEEVVRGGDTEQKGKARAMLTRIG
jgi:pilus assembly protein FimV